MVKSSRLSTRIVHFRRIGPAEVSGIKNVINFSVMGLKPLHLVLWCVEGGLKVKS